MGSMIHGKVWALMDEKPPCPRGDKLLGNSPWQRKKSLKHARKVDVLGVLSGLDHLAHPDPHAEGIHNT